MYAVTRDLTDKFAAWLDTEARRLLNYATPADLRAHRQRTMALALALARWTEYASLSPADAIPTMHRWLDQTQARAEARGAAPRAEAVALFRAWLSDISNT